LAGDITRAPTPAASILGLFDILFFYTFTMESVHHVSVSSKILFSKVRKIVPPMLEKFYKGS
jgi:hypothetical protein